MKLKTLILCSLLFARHQGGSESLDDFMTFAEKFEAKQPDDFALNTALDSTFLCTPVSLLQVLQNNESVLKATILDMYNQSLGLEPASLFDSGTTGSQTDLRCMHLRRILISTIQASKSEGELRELCIRLLFRIGLIWASPEDLLLAAKFQLLFKIDISDELRWMCTQSEVYNVFVTENKNTNATFDLKDKRDLVDHISYKEGQPESSVSYDYFASDDDFVYNFSSKRGLTRFKVNAGTKTAEVDIQNEEIKNYKHLTFVFHQGRLLVRHAGLPNQPFEIFDKASLKPVEGQQPIASQDPLEMMKWTDESEQGAAEGGKRFMRRTPLASDGEYVYALAAVREDKHTSKILKIQCEIYEVIDNHISIVSVVELQKENGDPYTGSKRRYQDQDGFLSHVNIACNGSYLILNTPERMHVFSMTDGIREKKEKLGTHLRWFDSKKNLLLYVDQNSNFSYLKCAKIDGFKQKAATALKVRLPKLPIILDALKLSIATELAKHKEQDRQPIKLHEQLIRKSVEDSLDSLEAKEGLQAPRFDSEIKDVHELTYSVILSVIGCHALIATAELKALGSKPLVNEELLDYFKTPFATFLGRDFINELVEQVTSLNQVAYEGKLKATSLFSLLNLLRLLNNNLRHMKCCRLSLDKILNSGDLAKAKTMNDSILAQMKPFDGSAEKSDDKLTQEEILQLHIVQAAKEIHEQLYECFDAETAFQKLQSLDTKIAEKEDSQSQATSQALLQLLSDQKQLSELFSGSLDDIESCRNIFGKICAFVGSSLKGRLSKALTEKVYTKGYDNRLDENASIFTNKFCEELMVAYSNQLLVLLETADAYETLAMIEREGDDSAKEAVRKPYFKFFKNNEVIDEVPYESDWASMEEKLREALKRHGGSNGNYKYDDGKVYQLRNLTEFNEAIENSGNKVMAVQYHNGCPTAERGWDEMKKNWKNIHMYKVNTLDADDIKAKYADGSSKPYFKFYRKGEFIDEVKYMSNWSSHRPAVEEVLAKYNGPDGSGRYKPEGPVEEFKILSDFKEVMEEAKEEVVAICYHGGEKQPQEAWNQLKLDNQNVWLFKINTSTYSAGSSKIARLNVKRFDTATEKIKVLDQIFYQTFIDITNYFKDQMTFLIDGLWKLDLNSWSDSELKDLFSYLEKVLSDENCLLRSIKKFCLMFCTYNVDITWLDEIAEGIKNVATLLSDFTVFSQNLPAKTKKSFRLQDPTTKFLNESLRQITYTVGVITQRLIKAEDGESESAVLKSLSKLNLLHGGVEDRFIPSLTDGTKHQIEGSFKITNDQELRDFALKTQDQIPIEYEDQFLQQVIGKDGECDEQTQLALGVLQQSLEEKTPTCHFASLGGDDGLRLARAAFGVLLKFSESIESFQNFSALVQEVDLEIDFEASEKERLKEIAKSSKVKESSAFKSLFQRWEQASQMRKWAEQTKHGSLDRIQKQVVEQFRKEVDAEHPSEPPFTAPLSEEQQETVDLLAGERHEAELQKMFDHVVQKALFLVKLQVPPIFRSRKNEALDKLQKKASTLAQKEAAAGEARNSRVEAYQKNAANQGNQADWINQLTLWNHIQRSTGGGRNSEQDQQGQTRSCSVSVLACLQDTSYTAKEIQARVEKTLILGLRRSAGINLMNFAFSLNISSKMFYDLLQWFQGSLRRNRSHSAHYLDGVRGCGERISQDISVKFFQIIERVVEKLKTVNKKNKIIHLIDALCWEYTRQDHDRLSKLNIFRVLSEGNGERNSLLKAAWGQFTGEIAKEKTDDMQLPSRLMQAFHYLFQVILGGIVEDTQAGQTSDSEIMEAGLSQIMSTTSTGSAQAAEALINQISEVLFQNIKKYLQIRRIQPFMTAELLKNNDKRFSEELVPEGKRGTIDYLMDDFEFFRLKFGEDGEKKWLKEEKVRLYKIATRVEEFVDRVNNFAKEGREDAALLAILSEVVGKALGSVEQPAMVQAIRERQPAVMLAIRNASYESLGMVEPDLTKEQIAVITGEQSEPEEEKKAEEEEKKEEEEKEVFLEDGFGTRYRSVQLEGNDVDYMLLSENGDLHDMNFGLIANSESFQDFGIAVKAQYIKPWPPREMPQEESKNEEQKEGEGKEAAVEPSVQEEKDLNRKILTMIKALEKVDEGEKLYVNEKDRIYHEEILFKILAMLDFLLSLLETSPLAKTLVSGFLLPDHLALLVDLSVEGLPHIQNIVQRIFQNLLRLDLPADIFEQAVDISCKREVDSKPWHPANEVKRLLGLQSPLKFEQSSFIQLIFNKILELRGSNYTSSIASPNMTNNPMTYERARTVRVLFTQGERKNVVFREDVKKTVRQALLSLESLTDAEMESTMLMVYEAGMKPLTSGQPCTDQKGQIFTVLGYNALQDYKQKEEAKVSFTEEFPNEISDNDVDVEVVCVSYDQEKPLQQVISKQFLYSLEPVLDLNKEETVAAAKLSLLNDPEVVEHLLKVWLKKDEYFQLTKNYRLLTMHLFIAHGFSNMLRVLGQEYVELLKANHLHQQIFMKISEVSACYFDDAFKKRCLLDYTLGSSIFQSSTKSFRTNEISISVAEDGKQLVCKVQRKAHTVFVKLPAIRWASEDPQKKVTMILEGQQTQQKCQFVSSAEMQSCSQRVLDLFRGKTALHAVITDKDIDLVKFIGDMHKAIAGFGGVSSGSGEYDPEAKIYELKNLTEFDQAVKDAGELVFAVMYHNGCSTQERGWDEMKPKYPNVRMYKVMTINAPDIRDRYADGSGKPYFKFYKKGQKFDEVTYDGSWDRQRPKVEEKMKEFNEAAGSCGKMVPRFLVLDKPAINTLLEIQEKEKVELTKNKPGWLFTHLYNKLGWLKEQDQSKYDNISLEIEQNPDFLKDALIQAFFNQGQLENHAEKKEQFEKAIDEILAEQEPNLPEIKLEEKVLMHRTSSEQMIKSKITDMQDDDGLKKTLEKGKDEQFTCPSIHAQSQLYQYKAVSKVQFASVRDYLNLNKNQYEEFYSRNLVVIKALEFFEARTCMELFLKDSGKEFLEEILDEEEEPVIKFAIFDFMHLHLEMQEHLELATNLKAFEDCKRNLNGILKQLKDNESWTYHFVRDLQTRMMLTRAAIDECGYNPGSLDGQNPLSMKLKGSLKRSLEPVSLMFFSNQILDHSYVPKESLLKFTMAMFDVHLNYALLYTRRITYQPHLTIDLLQGCLRAMKEIAKICQEKVSEGQKLEDKELLAWMTRNFLSQEKYWSRKTNDGIDEKSERQLVMFLIHLEREKILDLFEKGMVEEESHPSKAFLNWNKLKKEAQILQEGRSFETFLGKTNYQMLLTSNDRHLVSHFAEKYQTDVNSFKIKFSKTFQVEQEGVKLELTKYSLKDGLKVSINNGEQVSIIGQKSVTDGENIVQLPQGSTVNISFPFEPVTCIPQYKEGGQENLTEENIYLNGVTQLLSQWDNGLLIGDDERVQGFGDAQEFQLNGQPKGHKLRLIETPEDCKNFKKVSVGNKARLILTQEGKVFANGFSSHNQLFFNDYLKIPPEKYSQKFHEIDYPNQDDKIIDIACGYQATVCVTESGKIYARGCILQMDDSAKVKDTGYGQPYEISDVIQGGKLKGKPIQCWVNEALFINAVKSNGAIVTLGIGGHKYMRGTDDPHDAGNRMFWPLKVSDDTYMVQIKCCLKQNCGLDQHGNLWQWGELTTRGYSDGDCVEFRNEDNFCNFWAQWPVKYTWFQKQGLKILDFDCGDKFTIVKCLEPDESIGFYGLARDVTQIKAFGENIKKVFGGCICKLNSEFFGLDQVQHFSCGKDFISFVKGKSGGKTIPSIIPGKPNERGLIHFYKQDDKWQFLTQSEYQQNKSSLPPLTFACSHPIAGFKDQSFPDLEQLAGQIQWTNDQEESKDPVWSIKLTNQEKPTNPVTEPVYYSYAEFSGKEQKIFASEQEAIDGGNWFDMNPLIYYRIAKPCKNVEILPMLDIKEYFKQETGLIEFVINKQEPTPEKIASLPKSQHVQSILNFTPEMDQELIQNIDKQFQKLSQNEWKVNSYDLQNMVFRGVSPLTRMSADIVEARIKLLLKYSKAMANFKSYQLNSHAQEEGTLASKFLRAKNRQVPCILKTYFSNAMKEVYKNRVNEELKIEFDRPMAQKIHRSDQVDHEGKYSYFGQYMQRLLGEANEKSYLNKLAQDSKDKCKFSYKDEDKIDSMDYYGQVKRMLIKELEEGIVPLLIRSPNNRNQLGEHRDRYILNPSSSAPSHLQMYSFLGGLIAHSFMTSQPIQLKLSPIVWKQIIGDELSLSDLKSMDSYSHKMLVNLLDYGSQLTDAEFTDQINLNFTTVLSNGQQIALCNGGKEKRVTKANLQEFVDCVKKARFNESAAQVEAIQRGIQEVFNVRFDVIELLTWDQVELEVCGESKVETQKLKDITSYTYCSYDSEIIERFWRVFDKFTQEERKQYLQFVWGRTSIPEDTSKIVHKHQIRLIENTSRTSYPQAHSRFFQLDIPFYETDEICREKLSQAMESNRDLESEQEIGSQAT